MSKLITASMLYDLLRCPHRVSLDAFSDYGERGEVSPFVQMLWEKGSAYEKELMGELGTDFLDLSQYAGEEKEQQTLNAMKRGEALIYSARISAGELQGNPDLLRKEKNGYAAIDIKSGAGLENKEDLSKPKKHYCVQLALYTDILSKLGLSAGNYAYIWDIDGDEILYDFEQPLTARGKESMWDFYQSTLSDASAIVGKITTTKPAYASGDCKLCYWYDKCMGDLKALDDLTLIPELGRSKRDVMETELSSIADLAESDPNTFVKGTKTVFPRIGPTTLQKFHDRAVLLKSTNPKPYLTGPIQFPDASTELFFDIEVDPMRDICYMHGFIERTDGNTAEEKFVYFFADEVSAKSEEQAFADSIAYMQSKLPCAIYYYSKYEKTIYRKLRAKYPDVCSEDDIEELFDPAFSIDLYFDVVKKLTEWPTRDYSIKTLARYLGFNWRDTDPSGAASIEWFDQWIKTGDKEIKKRIIAYNEDDCIATRVLKDGIAKLN